MIDDERFPTSKVNKVNINDIGADRKGTFADNHGLFNVITCLSYIKSCQLDKTSTTIR